MRKNNEKKGKKRRDRKEITKRCLAVLLALLLTVQGTAFTSVYAADDTKTEEQKKEEEKTQTAAKKAAKAADDLEYEFPASIEVKNKDGSKTTYYDPYNGSDKAVTASSRTYKYKDAKEPEKEMIKDLLTTRPTHQTWNHKTVIYGEDNYSAWGEDEAVDIPYWSALAHWAGIAYGVFGQEYGGQKMYMYNNVGGKDDSHAGKKYETYQQVFGESSLEQGPMSHEGSDLKGLTKEYAAGILYGSKNRPEGLKFLSSRGFPEDAPWYMKMPTKLIYGDQDNTAGGTAGGAWFGASGSIYNQPKNADVSNAWATGLQMGNSLADAGDAMYDVVTTYLSPKLQASELRKYSDIPLLDNDEKQTVAYTFVGNSDRVSSGKFMYNCFGLVFYDFELVPIVETEKDDYGNNLIYTKETQNALAHLNKSTAVDDTPGIAYTPVGNGGKGETTIDVTTFDNSEMGSSLSASVNYTNSNSESTTRNESQTDNSSTTSNQSATFSYTHTRQKSGKLTGTKTNAFSVGTTLGFSETWGKAYTEGQSSTGSETETKGSSANATVSPYSILSVSQNRESSSLTLQYQQPCVISYKVAMVSIAGTYDKDTHPENYPQLQFCTVFGNVDKDGNEDNTEDDAIDRLAKRYNAREENAGQGIENDNYTLATRYNPGQTVKDDSPEVLSNKVDWKQVEGIIDPEDEKVWDGRDTSYAEMKIGHVVKYLNGYLHMMSTHGGAMSASIDNITYSLKQLVAKPFRVIDAKLKDGSNSTDLYLYKGETDIGLNATLSAYFSGGTTSWPGFKDTTKSGAWYITDRHGNDIAEPNEYGEQTTDNITLAQIDDGKWVLDCNEGTKEGTTVYLQYKFTDGYYSYYDKKTGEDTPITLEDYKADEGKLPMIKVHCYMTEAQAQRAKRLNASMFAGDGAGGWIAVAVVVVLVLAGGIFVLYRKRKKA